MLEKTLESPWTARRSNQSILKEISPEYSLEGLMLKLKVQYFVHLMWRTDSSEKTLMLGKTDGGRRRGRQRMKWLDGITDSKDMSLSKLLRQWKTEKDREAWHAVVHGVTKSRTRLSNWTQLNLVWMNQRLFLKSHWYSSLNRTHTLFQDPAQSFSCVRSGMWPRICFPTTAPCGSDTRCYHITGLDNRWIYLEEEMKMINFKGNKDTKVVKTRTVMTDSRNNGFSGGLHRHWHWEAVQRNQSYWTLDWLHLY